jgi:hypothetical protein
MSNGGEMVIGRTVPEEPPGECRALREGRGEIWSDQGLVFPSSVGTPLSHRNVVRSLKAVLRRAGLPGTIRLYDLRHTCATLLLSRNVHPKYIQELLGHASIALTLDTYSHVLPGMDGGTASAMDEALDVCCEDSARDRKGAIIVSPPQGATDGPAQPYPTPGRDERGSHRPLLPHRRCLRSLNLHGARRYQSIKRLADSEVVTLALFQQLRGVESERSFLRDTERFFSHLFPGVVGLHPSSFHRRVRKLRGFLEPLRREILFDMVGDPETVLVDSTLLSVLHPLLRFLRVRASAGQRG